MSIASVLKAAGVILISSLSQMTGIINSTSDGGKPVVVNIYSEFCGYSQQMAETFANYSSMTDNKNIGFYGADNNVVEGVGSEYEVKGVPTFIGFACGKEYDRVTGADPDGLSNLLTKLGNEPLSNYPFEMQEVTTIAAFADLLNSNRSVIVDFYADWCGPCKMIAPVLQNLSVANPGIAFVKVNVDHAQELTSKYGITAMPTFLAFSNGSQIGEVRGADKAGIEKLIASLN